MVLGVNFDSVVVEVGVCEYDVIIVIDGVFVWVFDQMVEIVSVLDGKMLMLFIWCEGVMLDIDVILCKMDLLIVDGFEICWLLGVNGGVFVEFDIEILLFGQVVIYGFVQFGYVINILFFVMKYMIIGQILICNLFSLVGIVEVFVVMVKVGLFDFIGFIGFLLVVVGLLNLFLILVFDGGYFVFYVYEVVIGCQLSDCVMCLLVMVGLVLVLMLMLFGLLNDIVFCL